MSRAFRLSACLVVACMGLLIAACGGSEDPTATATAQGASPSATATQGTQATSTATGPATATAAPTGSPAATSTPDSTSSPSGTLVIAVDNTYSMNSSPSYCPACSVTARTGTVETLLEAVRAEDGSLTVGPLLASSWKQSDDGVSYMDLTLRDDVEFHDGWGLMTAEDVAWSWNSANPNLTPDVVHDTGAEIAEAVASVEVLDEHTVRFHWNNFASFVPLRLLTNYSEGIPIFSKKFFDEVGEERMREELVGTGPFVMEEWTQHKGAFVRALETHWRKVPFVERVEFLEIAEPSIRRSALRSGQAQISQVETGDWPGMLADGYVQAPEGLMQSLAPTFVGNYWADVNGVDGLPLDSNEPGDAHYRPERDTSKPWIGDPDDPESMERSKKVRRALAMAIDREVLVDLFAPGFGQVQYAPGWNTADPLYKTEWDIPYDPEGARALLAEAGYPDGFEINWWAGNTSFATGEEAEAIGAMWLSELNVSSTFDKTAYTTYRPGLVNRTTTQLFIWQGNNGPMTWPHGQSLTTLTRPGLNSGVEIPFFEEIYLGMQEATSEQELIDLVHSMYDYNNEWTIQTGVLGKPAAALYDPEAVESWKMLPEGRGLMGRINSVEWVKLKD